MPRRINNKTVTKDTEVTKVTIDESRGSVTIEKGLTKGLPDYSSARISVRMTLPIDFTEDDVIKAKQTMRRVNSVIDRELNSQVEELIETIKSMKE